MNTVELNFDLERQAIISLFEEITSDQLKSQCQFAVMVDEIM